MNVLDYVLGGILLVAAVFLIIAVLMQEGKSKGIGAVSGGTADTFFGKTKGKTWTRTLAKLTTIVGVFFVVVVLLVYIIQDDADYDKFFDENSALLNQAETTVKDEEEEKKPEESAKEDETEEAKTEDTTVDTTEQTEA